MHILSALSIGQMILSIPVVALECISKYNSPEDVGFLWKECACRCHWCVSQVVEAVDCEMCLLASAVSLSCCWFFEPARPHSSVEFQLCTALQDRVNADQHFDSKSDHERGEQHFFLCLKASSLLERELWAQTLDICCRLIQIPQ